MKSTTVTAGNCRRNSGSHRTPRWRKTDSNLYGVFPVKWLFSVYCQFFVRSGKAVLRPVACGQVRGARGRGQGTETLAQLGGLPPSVACVSQRPPCSGQGQALTPERTRRDDEQREGHFCEAPASRSEER